MHRRVMVELLFRQLPCLCTYYLSSMLNNFIWIYFQLQASTSKHSDLKSSDVPLSNKGRSNVVQKRCIHCRSTETFHLGNGSDGPKVTGLYVGYLSSVNWYVIHTHAHTLSSMHWSLTCMPVQVIDILILMFPFSSISVMLVELITERNKHFIPVCTLVLMKKMER